MLEQKYVADSHKAFHDQSPYYQPSQLLNFLDNLF